MRDSLGRGDSYLGLWPVACGLGHACQPQACVKVCGRRCPDVNPPRPTQTLCLSSQHSSDERLDAYCVVVEGFGGRTRGNPLDSG
jgi:hypothetical protein